MKKENCVDQKQNHKEEGGEEHVGDAAFAPTTKKEMRGTKHMARFVWLVFYLHKSSSS